MALTELVRSALVPAYRKAVDTVDPLAAMEMATHVVSAYSGIDRTREELETSFPGNDPTRWMVSTPDSPVGDTTDMTEAKWTELRGYATGLTVDAPSLSRELLSQLGPQSFRGNEVLGGAVAPAAKKDGPARVTNEAGRVVELLAVVVRARALAGSDGNSCVALDEAQQTSIAALIEPYRTRPIDLAFLVEVLRAECLWESIEGARGPSGHTLAGTLDKSLAQAKQTGAFQDMGDWDIEKVSELLRGGDDNTAHQVFLELKYLRASARGPAIRQLERMGLLDAFCRHMPWKYIEALHGVVAESDTVAASQLLPYFEDEGGGKSLHKEYEENAMDNIEEGGFINNAQAFGWVFLDTAHNALTGGFLHEYSAAYDAREQGWITEDEFDSAAAKALGKAAVITLAGAAVGGAAGAWAEGVATGLNAGKSAAAVIGGGVGGFAGGVAGHFAGDVYDQLLNDKEGFDSVGKYMQSGAAGGVAGTVLAGVSVAAGRYLPASQQRMVDIYASRYPRMTQAYEALHTAGAGQGARVRVTVSKLMEWMGGGGAGPGARAFALPDGGDWRLLPGDTEIEVTLSTVDDLSRPAMMSGNKDGVGGGVGDKDGPGAGVGDKTTDPVQEPVIESTPPIKVESVEVGPEAAEAMAKRPKLPDSFEGDVLQERSVIEHSTTAGRPKTEFTKLSFKMSREQQIELLSENIQGITPEQAEFMLDYVQSRGGTVVFGGSRQKGVAGADSDLDVGFSGLKRGQVGGAKDKFNARFAADGDEIIEHDWIYSGAKPRNVEEIVSPEEFFMRSGTRAPHDPKRPNEPFGPSGYTKIGPDGTVEIGIPD